MKVVGQNVGVPAGLWAAKLRFQSMAELRRLPVDWRIELVLDQDIQWSRSDIATFLAGILLDAPPGQCQTTYMKLQEDFNCLDADLAYRKAAPIIDECPDDERAVMVKFIYMTHLENAGYRLGYLQRVTCGNRFRRRTSHRWQVSYKGVVYILDRNHVDYLPTDGDEVIFAPATAVPLGVDAFAVRFYPVKESLPVLIAQARHRA